MDNSSFAGIVVLPLSKARNYSVTVKKLVMLNRCTAEMTCIDHCAVSGELSFNDYNYGAVSESGHYRLIANISLRGVP